eukprot:183787-Chlamydomonas_euryale.AAC.1
MAQGDGAWGRTDPGPQASLCGDGGGFACVLCTKFLIWGVYEGGLRILWARDQAFLGSDVRWRGRGMGTQAARIKRLTAGAGRERLCNRVLLSDHRAPPHSTLHDRPAG